MDTLDLEVWMYGIVLSAVLIMISVCCGIHAYECVNITGEYVMSCALGVTIAIAAAAFLYETIDSIYTHFSTRKDRRRIEQEADRRRRELIAGLRDGSIQLDTTPHFMRQHN